MSYIPIIAVPVDAETAAIAGLTSAAFYETTGIKFAFTNPTSPTSHQEHATVLSLSNTGSDTGTVMGMIATNAAGSLSFSAAAFIALGVQSALGPSVMAADINVRIRFTIFNGANAGTHQLKFAQTTADATNLTIKKGSSMVATRVG